MAAMHSYPIMTISETYIRQHVYDSLPDEVRAKLSFEDFRAVMSPEDYRYFASVMSDLINDYVTENDLFSDFMAQAVTDTVAKNEKLTKLYMAKNIYRGSDDIIKRSDLHNSSMGS
jgi:hypothetical protein